VSMNFERSEIVDWYWKRSPCRKWLDLLQDVCRNLYPQSLLDVGCGSGIYGRALARVLGIRSLTLMDASPVVVSRLLHEQQPGETIMNASIEDLATQHIRADLVLAKSVLHHCADRAHAVTNLMRAVQPEGCLVLQTRTREQFLTPTEFEFYMGAFPDLHNKLSLRYPTHDELKTVLAPFSCDVFVLSYVDIVRASVSTYINQLRIRAGNSILFDMSDEQLRSVIEAVSARYSNCCTVELCVPMTIWIARSHSSR
jgi:SAM-dependent methyltransferase